MCVFVCLCVCTHTCVCVWVGACVHNTDTQTHTSTHLLHVLVEGAAHGTRRALSPLPAVRPRHEHQHCRVLLLIVVHKRSSAKYSLGTQVHVIYHPRVRVCLIFECVVNQHILVREHILFTTHASAHARRVFGISTVFREFSFSLDRTLSALVYLLCKFIVESTFENLRADSWSALV